MRKTLLNADVLQTASLLTGHSVPDASATKTPRLSVYALQYASILIWIFGDQYYSYSACIFIITWFSIISSAVEAHSNMKRLADIAQYSWWVTPLQWACTPYATGVFGGEGVGVCTGLGTTSWRIY